MNHPAPEAATFLSRPQLYGGFGGFAQPDGGQLPYGYGAAPSLGGLGKAPALFARSQRQRLNVVPMCQCFLLPWLFFCLIYAATSFKLHYASPSVCWAVVAGGLLLVLAAGGFALHAAWRKFRAAGAGGAGAQPRPPSWLIFLFVTSLLAWTLGVVLGDLNFWTNMQPYYDYTNLNEHVAIDPARMRGQEFMDAGRVTFSNTSALDLRKSMGFRNLDTYCVAPITVQSHSGTLLPLQSYDFWAVGLGCCQTHTADFHCGEFNNPSAHQGLRLLRDDQRDFFRLAVQQAEATHSIKAAHPLFFFWVGDATAEMESFRDDGYKYFLIGMLAHFSWQMLCVALAVAGFAKLGHL